MIDIPGGMSRMNDTSDVLRWYTREELASRWHVSEKTVSNWLWKAKTLSLGPNAQQYRRQRGRRRRGCVMLIRSDYANALFDWAKKM